VRAAFAKDCVAFGSGCGCWNGRRIAATDPFWRARRRCTAISRHDSAAWELALGRRRFVQRGFGQAASAAGPLQLRGLQRRQISEKGGRLAQKMQVGPCIPIPVRVQL
jgi:hypothetical protein